MSLRIRIAKKRSNGVSIGVEKIVVRIIVNSIETKASIAVLCQTKLEPEISSAMDASGSAGTITHSEM